MPERSRHRGPEGPRHARPGSAPEPWWRLLHPGRWAVGVAVTLVAVPLLVLDNLPEGQLSAGAVETADMAKATTSTELEQSADEVAELAALAAPATTAPPTTAPPTTAPPTTAPPTTAPPTTAPPTTAPPTTAPPTTAPPTTAPPTTAPPSAGSVDALIRSTFGAQGDNAVAVARCESGLNPAAYNPAGPYYGLFQIGAHHAANFQAVTGVSLAQGGRQAGPNVLYAKWLYDRSGWGQWGCRYVVQ